MVVKSMSRKTVSFAQLLGYFRRGAAEECEPILHNLISDTAEAIDEEFRANAQHIVQPGRVILFHEVISLAVADRPYVDQRVLEDLARFYLERRAPDSLAYGQIHLTANAHVHLLISGNRIASSRQSRLSRQEFDGVKLELERYQRERYPLLSHSLVHAFRDGRSARVKRGRAEGERSRRLRAAGKRDDSSRKDLIAAFFRETAELARSEEEWRQLLGARNLRLYRRGTRLGIEEGLTSRKYRLATLGVEEIYGEASMRWARTAERVESLEQIVRKQRTGLRGHDAARDKS
jgi:hypothetical protein